MWGGVKEKDQGNDGDWKKKRKKKNSRMGEDYDNKWGVNGENKNKDRQEREIKM